MEKLKNVKLTVLCDNAVGVIGGIGEHGYSVFVEAEGGPYLFDTGSGIGLIPNARLLRKDLASVKKIFLSHGHYDHTGGLSDALDIMTHVPVYAHPSVFDEKFSFAGKYGETGGRFIGIPERRALLESKGAVFNLSAEFREVGAGLFLTGEITRTSEFTVIDDQLRVRSNDSFEIDLFPDDQALVLATVKGLVVLLGCSHAGTVNTIRHVQSKLYGQPLYAVIGGTHWGFMNEEDLSFSITTLNQMDIKLIGLSHCTGFPAAHRIMSEFGNRAFYAAVGSTVEVC